MNSSMRSIFIHIAALVCAVTSRPQNNFLNEVISTTTELYPVDGFVFDGPVNAPDINPLNPGSNSGRGATSSRPTSTDSAPTPTPTISDTTAQLIFNQCFTDCPVTPEYNPVCGTDNVQYSNPGRLKCAARCGRDVEFQRYGRCTTGSDRG